MAIVITLSVDASAQSRFRKDFFVDLVLISQLDFGLERVNFFCELRRKPAYKP
jgi:hypothetical protein